MTESAWGQRTAACQCCWLTTLVALALAGDAKRARDRYAVRVRVVPRAAWDAEMAGLLAATATAGEGSPEVAEDGGVLDGYTCLRCGYRAPTWAGFRAHQGERHGQDGE